MRRDIKTMNSFVELLWVEMTKSLDGNGPCTPKIWPLNRSEHNVGYIKDMFEAISNYHERDLNLHID